jgi:hypothetical protein
LKTSDPRPRIVLDTNVVLDWLLFDDPSVEDLACAIQDDAIRWLACPQMRAELDPRWPLQNPPPVATPNSSRQDGQIIGALRCSSWVEWWAALGLRS